MNINFEKPLSITCMNKGKRDSFIPYGENFSYFLNTGDSITFNNVTSDEAIYYTKQASKNILINKVFSTDADITVGKYNSSNNSFTAGASYNTMLVNVETKVIDSDTVLENDYVASGTLPYEAADASIGMPAGNRFAIKISNPEITSKSDLPSGDIAIVSKSNGSTNTYTKSAFESDGTLIAVLNVEPYSVITVKIKWTNEANKYSLYKFTFADCKLGKENEVFDNVNILNISLPANFTITNNNTDTSVGYVPYKENFVKYISAGDSVTFTVTKGEEAIYYLLQANNNLSVTL